MINAFFLDIANSLPVMNLGDPELRMMAKLLVANHGDQAACVAEELEKRFTKRGEADLAAAYEQIRKAIASA